MAIEGENSHLPRIATDMTTIPQRYRQTDRRTDNLAWQMAILHYAMLRAVIIRKLHVLQFVTSNSKTARPPTFRHVESNSGAQETIVAGF